MESDPVSVAALPAGPTLAMLEGIGLPLPSSTRDTREPDQPVEAALLEALDKKELVSKAENVMAKGEKMLQGLHDAATGEAATGVLRNLESKDLEEDLLDGVKRFNPDAFLRDCDRAVVDSEARQTFVNQILDICLDFLLRLLPGIKIPEVSGSHRGTAFRIYDLDMSGIRFRKEDVVVSFLDFKGAAGSALHAVKRPRESEIVRIDAKGISAQFSKLHCSVKPPLLPETQPVATGVAGGISLRLHLAADVSSDASEQRLRISRLKVAMESLELKMDQANVVNALISHLNEYLKGYVCGVLEESLAAPLSQLCQGVNDLLIEAKPLLVLLGWPAFVSRASAGPKQEETSDGGALSTSLHDTLRLG